MEKCFRKPTECCTYKKICNHYSGDLAITVDGSYPFTVATGTSIWGVVGVFSLEREVCTAFLFLLLFFFYVSMMATFLSFSDFRYGLYHVGASPLIFDWLV